MTKTAPSLAQRLRALNDEFELDVLGKRVPELDEAAAIFEKQDKAREASIDRTRERSLARLAEVDDLLSVGFDPWTILLELQATAASLYIKATRYGRPDIADTFRDLRNMEQRQKRERRVELQKPDGTYKTLDELRIEAAAIRAEEDSQ